MMNKLAVAVITAALSLAQPFAQTRSSRTLDIYIVDVEGGNATLFVTPAGESVLIDTGNGGPAAVRDADRIMAAVKEAGITQIDALITSHWHGDHMGAMAELAGRIPVRHYLDHGPNVQPAAAVDEFLQKTYPSSGRKGEAHGGEGRRYRAVEGCAVANRDIRPRNHHEAVAWSRPAESPLRGVQAAHRQSRFRSADRKYGRRAFRGIARHLRTVSRALSGRFPMEQGIRADVPRPTGWARSISCSSRVMGSTVRTPKRWFTRCGRASVQSTTEFEREDSRRRCACCIRARDSRIYGSFMWRS